MSTLTDPSCPFLRHALATLAYRTRATLRDAPTAVASARAGEGGRTAVEILAHMGDLMDWSLSIARGAETWRQAEPLAWDAETARFFASLDALDAYLASDAPLCAPAEKLLQGPIADALTHVGQIALLRRMAGSPPAFENYFRADIAPAT